MSTRLRTDAKRFWPLIKKPANGAAAADGPGRVYEFTLSRHQLANPAGADRQPLPGNQRQPILNMWYDRDIDAKMSRTAKRPLPSGDVSPQEALRLGLIFAVAGVGWAVALDALYGLIVFAGLFFDVVVYTIWLKRRTPWSIIWGGISGGMPVLAGRALGMGQIEWVGVALALAVLFWIPTHIMTFSLRYREDYAGPASPPFPPSTVCKRPTSSLPFPAYWRR
ncbi:MAG: UbiA family prenyltransferase [Chloroflexi bacterium]|nr:UbiA family prenyltransferase [Chloroflexota bacterium]